MTSPNSSGPERELGAVKNNSAGFDSTVRIGASVETELDRELWRLTGGETTLSDYTPALQAWWAVAAEFGRQTASTDRIERLEWERDFWFWRFHNPGKDFYAATTDRLWAEAGGA